MTVLSPGNTYMQDRLVYFCSHRWFRKDDNAVPPAYFLLPISYHLPDFVNKETEASNNAKATWWQENEMMAQALYEAALKHHTSEEEREKYLVSGTVFSVSLVDLSY